MPSKMFSIVPEALTQQRIETLRRIGSATLYEAQGQTGAFDSGIKPLDPGFRMAGTAFTIDSAPGDNLMLHHALTVAQPGDVLVMDAKGFMESGHAGDITAFAAVTAKLAGFVIDGAVRDVDAVIALNFPVFARGLSIKVVTKNHVGRVNVPILCGGTPVNPGDVIVGDRDGIVAIPADTIDAVIAHAAERERKEAAFRDQISRGAATIDLVGVRARLQSMKLL